MVAIHTLPFWDLPHILSRPTPESEDVDNEGNVFRAPWPQEMKISTFHKVLAVVYDIFSLLFLPLGIVRLIAWGIKQLSTLFVLPAADPSRCNDAWNQNREWLLEQELVTSFKIQTPDDALLDGVIIKNPYQTEGYTLVDFLGNATLYEYRGTDGCTIDGISQVVRMNYRGAGKSCGSITPEGLALDGFSLIQYLHIKLQIPLEKILIKGWSLGGFVGAYAASKHPGVRFLSDRSFSSLAAATNEIVSNVAGRVLGTMASGLIHFSGWGFLDSKTYWDQIQDHKWIAYHPKDEIIFWNASLAASCPQDSIYPMEDCGEDGFEAHGRPWNPNEINHLKVMLA